MKKRIISCILCLVMVMSLLAACGKEASNNDASAVTNDIGTTTAPAGSQSGTADTSTPVEASEIKSTFTSLDGETIEIPTGVQFPLEEEITLTFWYPVGWNFVGEMSSLGESEIFQYMKEKTNVNVEFVHPAEGTDKEAYNLLYASNKMPDILYSNSEPTYEYASGPEAAVTDGYYLDLTDLVAQYAPNYSALLARNEVASKNAKTDSGKILSFYHIYDGIGKACNAGPSIRADFLDKVGLKVEDLVTYDDWYNALTAIKQAGLAEVPLYLPGTGVMENDEFTAGYGAAQDFIVVDGVVKYGVLEDGYGEYLAMMNKWYNEGLIDADFTLNQRDPEEADVISNKYAAWWSYCSWNGTKKWGNQGVDESFNLVGTRLPVKSEGEIAHYRVADTIVNVTNFHITADCEYPEIAVAWMDLFYNEQIALIGNYGLGDTHVKNADGTYDWSEKITQAADSSAARGKYVMPNAFLENYTRVSNSWSEAQKQSQQNWLASADYAYVIPSYVSMTAEENEAYAAVMGDIATFVEEESSKIIAGTSSYTFETFRDKIYELNIDQAIASKQAAMDRYNNR